MGATRRFYRSAVVTVLMAFCVLTVSPPAIPQPAQPPAGQAKGERRKARKRIAKLRERVLRKKVGLSEDKIKKVVAVFNSQQAERHALHKQVHLSRKAIGKLFKEDSDDQQAYATQLDALQQAHRSIAQLREDQIATLRKVLTPKEQAKLFRAMEHVKRRLDRRRHQRRGNRR